MYKRQLYELAHHQQQLMLIGPENRMPALTAVFVESLKGVIQEALRSEVFVR